MEKLGARVGSDSRYFRHDGTPIAPVQVTDSSGWNATFGMHRADLVEMLADALPAGVVHTGHRCTGFEQDGDVGAGVVRQWRRGAKPTSSSRRTASTPSFGRMWLRLRGRCSHGSVAYRGLVPHERVPHWPTDRWQMWLGTGKHFLAFPVRAGELINYVGFVPADEEMKESWSAPGDPDVLRASSPAGIRASSSCCGRCRRLPLGAV